MNASGTGQTAVPMDDAVGKAPEDDRRVRIAERAWRIGLAASVPVAVFAGGSTAVHGELRSPAVIAAAAYVLALGVLGGAIAWLAPLERDARPPAGTEPGLRNLPAFWALILSAGSTLVAIPLILAGGAWSWERLLPAAILFLASGVWFAATYRSGER